MAQKSIDDLREEMGLSRKSRKRSSNNYVSLHLAFRLREEEAKKLLLKCEELGTSESLFARQAILEKLKQVEGSKAER